MRRLPVRFRRYSIALLLAAIIPACGKKPGQIAHEHLDSAEDAYRTNSIRAAERAMIDHLQTLADDESKARPGVDYDMARAITHERLFMIYRKLDDTNREGIEFQQSLEWLDRYKKRIGASPTTNLTHEAFAALLERSEHGLDIRWKKE